MTTLDQIAKALGGEISGGQVRAPGPGHSGVDRSLSVKLDEKAPDGFLVHSFAGDDDIACRDFVREKLGLKGNGKAADGAWKLVREHIYRTADGAPHLRKQKKIDPKGERQFPQHHWDGAKWVKGVPKSWPKLLYRLPELLKAPLTSIAYVTEGEGDADTLAALGFVATTAGGVSETKVWAMPEVVAPLKDRRVVVCVDSDTPGRRYGQQVARALDKIAASIKVVDLFPEDRAERDGRDVTDFISTDRAGVKFVRMVNDAPEWEPSATADKPATSSDDGLIAELAALSPLEYDRRREAKAEKLKVRVSTLDKLVAAACGEEIDDGKQGRAVAFPEIEPWPETVEGAELLDALADVISQHVVMSEASRDVCALCAVHPCLLDRFYCSPRLAIVSPTKQCGKTTLLDVLAQLVARPLPTANVTAAAVFRTIEIYQPTLLIDEGDTFLGERDELRGILNSGHRRGGSVLRTVGDDHEPRAFSTYAACAIALIGKLPDTLHDRSIEIALKRRLPSEAITPLRLDRVGHLEELARKIVRWAGDHANEIGATDPEMPEGVFNRAADNWRPLLAIAEVAGGDWPERARKAADADCKAAENGSRLEQLLADIQAIFAARKVDRLPSADLVDALVAIEGGPWAEYGKARKPITKNQLARALSVKGVGIAPVQIRFSDDDSRKGYRLEDFADAFERFLSAGKGASKPKQRNKCDGSKTSDLFQTETDEPDVSVGKCEKSNNDGPCFGVSVQKGGIGEETGSSPLDAPDLPPGAELVGRAPAGERCYLCGKAGRVFLIRRRGGVDQLHLECAGAKPSQTANEGALDREVGFTQLAIERFARWYCDQAEVRRDGTEIDQPVLDAELRRRLAEEVQLSPEDVEIVFERIMVEVFKN